MKFGRLKIGGSEHNDHKEIESIVSEAVKDIRDNI